MTAEPARRSGLFTRDDGRDRVAVPLGDGILSALGAIGILICVLFALIVVLVIVVLVTTHKQPSPNPADPGFQTATILSYAAGGWFAWWRLRRMRPDAFRRLTRGDAITLLYGVGGLIVVDVLTSLLLNAMHQTKHIQSGFEHFDLSSKVPGGLALAIALTVASLVLVGPLVEEIVFRGLLFGALASRLGVFASALIVAGIFGIVHADLVLLPTLAGLGFVSALAYARSGNLWTSVTLHALNNALGAGVLVATTLRHAHH